MIGSLEGKAPPPAPAEEKKAVIVAPKAADKQVTTPKPESFDAFGDVIPFGDPSWYQGVSTVPPQSPSIRPSNNGNIVPLPILQ